MWRLVPTLELPGNMQMAIDTWLFRQHLAGNHPPTLRFYTWASPTISLGYHQKTYPQFWETLNWKGQKLDLVHRPTGGRAVLHQGDLTYAAIASGLSEKRIIAYKQICEFLIVGWRNLGLELNYGQAGRGYIRNPNCFATATSADLVTNQGFKFIGSAQLRQGKTILQHGSMRISPNLELFQRVFPQDLDIQNYQESCPNIDRNLHTIIEKLIVAASECLDMQLQIQPFTPQEWQDIYTFL